jgi:hypothetical protein
MIVCIARDGTFSASVRSDAVGWDNLMRKTVGRAAKSGSAVLVKV